MHYIHYVAGSVLQLSFNALEQKKIPEPLKRYETFQNIFKQFKQNLLIPFALMCLMAEHLVAKISSLNAFLNGFCDVLNI